MRAARLLGPLVLVAASLASSLPVAIAQAAEPAPVSRAVPDHLGGTDEEMMGWWAVIDEKWIAAREIGERVLKANPASFAGHYVLAMAYHYGEGDLARGLYHLELGMKEFERVHGEQPTDGPWRWHESTLKEMAFVLGEMNR